MPDNELFTIALNLEKPWYVKEVKFDPSGKRLDIYIWEGLQNCFHVQYAENHA